MIWLVVLFAGLLRSDSAGAADLSATEFKAVFLSKCLPYVRWPSDSLPARDEPIILGLFGYDPFNGLIQQLLSTQTIDGHKVEVRVLPDADRLEGCQVLYVPDDKLRDWLELKPEGAGRGVLTVSVDTTGKFLESGGVFNLLVDERKLEISRRAADKAGLKINSKLLRIAKLK
jgi:hypothetical protein